MKLASDFIDERGQQQNYFDEEALARGDDPAKFWAKTYAYCQAHVPFREQTKVVGHAVRAVYLLSAVADLAHENDDPTLRETSERLENANLLGGVSVLRSIGTVVDESGWEDILYRNEPPHRNVWTERLYRTTPGTTVRRVR